MIVKKKRAQYRSLRNSLNYFCPTTKSLDYLCFLSSIRQIIISLSESLLKPYAWSLVIRSSWFKYQKLSISPSIRQPQNLYRLKLFPFFYQRKQSLLCVLTFSVGTQISLPLHQFFINFRQSLKRWQVCSFLVFWRNIIVLLLFCDLRI